jgi:hypothetical protein
LLHKNFRASFYELNILFFSKNQCFVIGAAIAEITFTRKFSQFKSIRIIMAPILHRNGFGSSKMIWLEFCKTAMVKQKIVAKREKEQN